MNEAGSIGRPAPEKTRLDEMAESLSRLSARIETATNGIRQVADHILGLQPEGTETDKLLPPSNMDHHIATLHTAMARLEDQLQRLTN